MRVGRLQESGFCWRLFYEPCLPGTATTSCSRIPVKAHMARVQRGGELMLGAGCTAPELTSRSGQPVEREPRASASGWVIAFAKRSVFVFSQRYQPAKGLAQPQLPFPLGMLFHLLPSPPLFSFLLPHSHRAHVLKTVKEILLSPLNRYFRNLYFSSFLGRS